ncbi:MAG: flagellar biosynthetic protein FliO, partial [Bdellovibrionota bacterium]
MKKIKYIVALFFVCYNTYSLAESEYSVVMPLQQYTTDENKIQIPLTINNNPQENNQKIETTLSQEIKEQALVSKKEVTPTDREINADFKAFVDKKNYLKENKDEPSLWQGASLVVGFISFIGIIAFILAKIGKRGFFKTVKEDKEINIISTLSISPKRQIMLVQVRDKEIVITNTESGICFLAEAGSRVEAKETAMEKKQFQIENFIKSLPTQEAIKAKQEPEVENKSIINEKKSDILMKALKRMEKG